MLRIKKLNTRPFQSRLDLFKGERVAVKPIMGALHALHGREMDAGAAGEFPGRPVQERARRADMSRRQQGCGSEFDGCTIMLQSCAETIQEIADEDR